MKIIVAHNRYASGAPSGENVIVDAEIEQLRAAGVAVLMHAGGHGMKAQFRRADASGARHALVFGADEVARGEVGLKSLRDAAVPQRSLPLASVADWAGELRGAATGTGGR